MTVTNVHKDPTTLSMTVTSEWNAPIDRVWQLWADPRQLERWWGPPTYPATFVEHDLRPGGKVTYFMTGPEGDEHHGWWAVAAVDEPHRLELEDGFAHTDGSPNPDLPTTTMVVTLAEVSAGVTRMFMESRFPSAEAMEQLISMGMDEGLSAAMSQIGAILAGD